MGKYPNKTHYSEHFSRSELDCKCDRHGIGPKKHSVLIRRRLRMLAINLEKMRKEYGKSIGITSGYRCEAHNEEVHGAIMSQHVKARAADIAVPGTATTKKRNQKKMKDAAESVRAFKRGGVGTDPSGDLHVDMRGSVARWSSYIGWK